METLVGKIHMHSRSMKSNIPPRLSKTMLRQMLFSYQEEFLATKEVIYSSYLPAHLSEKSIVYTSKLQKVQSDLFSSL
jgi:hypothetical protein